MRALKTKNYLIYSYRIQKYVWFENLLEFVKY